jgi:signal transduction histidine kinase
MRRKHSKLVGIAWFLFVFLFLVGMFTASYYLTAFVLKAANLSPPAFLVQVFNSLLGLVLAGILIGSAGKIARSRGWIPEQNVFRPIIEALEKIAAGDFSIRVDGQFQENQIVGELANSVNRMALELDHMENMRQEFISNVSHEIQSPLTSIRGFALALENDGLDLEQRRHYLGIIQNESTRLSRITEDLLKLASLESDRFKFEPKSYRLDKQIRSLILACEPQWQGKNLELDIALEEVEITADEDLLSQVWTNLIYNSIKFTQPGGKVRIGLTRMDGKIAFKISDTRLGISVEDQKRVFERFYKADQSRTYSNGGSGLGLSIARKIVEIHKGTIDVASQPGAGTTFTVSLPS